jgi:hypothetical protein
MQSGGTHRRPDATEGAVFPAVTTLPRRISRPGYGCAFGAPLFLRTVRALDPICLSDAVILVAVSPACHVHAQTLQHTHRRGLAY